MSGKFRPQYWSRVMRGLARIFKDQRGATAVEYSLILALIFLAVIGTVSSVASGSIAMWNNVSAEMVSNS